MQRRVAVLALVIGALATGWAAAPAWHARMPQLFPRVPAPVAPHGGWNALAKRAR